MAIVPVAHTSRTATMAIILLCDTAHAAMAITERKHSGIN
jgi:hypothetical protein